MPSDKASYLAAHYLTADPKPSTSKKRKRKHASSKTDGLLIQDDDEPGWTTNPTSHDNNDEETPITIAGTSAEFRRAKKSAWKTLTSTSTTTSPAEDAAAADADAIIASAAAEQAAAAALDEDGPSPIPMMSDGTHAGLQSAKAITAQLRIRQAAERAELARITAERATKNPSDAAQEDEVILRDATGRRVDAAMRRAEMRRAQAEAERAEEERKRNLKGEVQLAEARRRREELQDAALMPLARGKDDVEMNRELQEQQRWNDPMAQFMDSKESGARGTGTGKNKKMEARRPLYKGAAPPNRYGIKPGYRWDGVDRGNGFEAERFKAINRKERNKGLDYAWQMDE
ncbi:putative pre-mRNA splicing protein [Echria macrotheca]|uniref:Pre-mRNA splicing protein n=1 Tax=Echria macrotheca TaxID=438768 RepID=A0AAJ0BJP8_9PEZI|nr:putative pre-mRNA splicing protein [Echria macrotheca]